MEAEATHMERPLGAALTRWLPESPLFQPLDSSRTAPQTHLLPCPPPRSRQLHPRPLPLPVPSRNPFLLRSYVHTAADRAKCSCTFPFLPLTTWSLGPRGKKLRLDSYTLNMALEIISRCSVVGWYTRQTNIGDARNRVGSTVVLWATL